MDEQTGSSLKPLVPRQISIDNVLRNLTDSMDPINSAGIDEVWGTNRSCTFEPVS